MKDTYAILIDTTLCSGCERCVSACKKEYGLGQDKPRPWKNKIDDLSSTRYITISKQPDNKNVRKQCRHCLNPPCVSACLVGAMQKTNEGPVIYDKELCMGCRYCMVACPFGIPKYDWEKAIPYVRKCIMCYPKIKLGKLPACVEACPEGTVRFGMRGELIKFAKNKIYSDTKYIKHIWGEKEIGGTSVLYISDISLDFLSFKPELGEKPIPELTMAALSKVPPIVLAMGGLMTGTWWVIGRRMKLEKEKHEQDKNNQTGEEKKND